MHKPTLAGYGSMGKKTPLYQSHLEAGAKMVEFGGWELPIHYGSQIEEHQVVRTDAGMFDVSHMTVVDVCGVDARPYLSYLLANDVATLNHQGKAMYSCMLNDTGGIVDDLIVYFLRDNYYRMVVNAATREKDLQWLVRQAVKYPQVSISELADTAMIAVQGPTARDKVLSILSPQQRACFESLKRFEAAEASDYFVARTGYTGEDGFEILTAGGQVVGCWDQLLRAGVRPCGLGARDTLRLEAGLSLYGVDMDEFSSPLISGLSWTLQMCDDREFIGKQAIQQQQRAGVDLQMVGLVLLEKGVLRNHLKVITEKGEGWVCSGSYAPTLGQSVALARVPVGVTGEVEVEIRDKRLRAAIVKPPFTRLVNRYT